MSKYFSEKDIEDFRQCFKFYAKEGYVTNSEKLGFIMRSLGMSPTQLELKNYFQAHKREDGQIDFAEFLTILHEYLQKLDIKLEILNAFTALDPKNTGLITSNDLRLILTSTGEKLSSRDVDVMIREIGTQKDGKINYKNLITTFTTPIPDY